MPTRIRLQRKGKKGRPFYHLVVADGRAPRDGKFIEKLGTYDPMTTPATIELNFDRSLYWVQVGAQPSDTARSILSNKGIMLKHHLLKGVKKGALTEEQAEEKFQEWLKEKEAKLQKMISDDRLSEKEKQKKRIEEERKINEARAEVLSKKQAEENLKEESSKDVEAKEGKAEAEVEKQEQDTTTEEVKQDVPEKEEVAKEEVKADDLENKDKDVKEDVKADAEDKNEEQPKKDTSEDKDKKDDSTKDEVSEEESTKENKETQKAEEEKEENKEDK